MDVETLSSEEKKVHSYFFPDILGKAMLKVPLDVQYEAGLVSMALMSIGLIMTGIYLMIYISFPLWYKIFLIINLLAGLVFFISNLTTTFQQYNNYKDIKEFNKQLNSDITNQ
jgi:hypothetical protein